jgi:regulator of protease activity HflC (stomatin/prohibitin superfamily)
VILVLTLALVAIAVGLVAYSVWARRAPFREGERPRSLLPLAGLFAVLALASTALVIVPAGYVGVVTNFGRVEERTLLAGLQLIIPVAEAVTIVDTRVQPHDFNDIDAASKEYQQVRASGKLNYHIDPQFAYIVYRQVGLDFANKVIDPALNDFIKEAMPQYAIAEILPSREQIRQKAKDAMNANLARYHIIVDDIYLANLAFSEEYEQAIEDKQVAQQQVQTQQQVLEQKRIQAQQAVVDAEGKANAAVALATGQAEANRLLAESLSPELIQYTAITKLNDKISVILLPATGNFLIDTRGLLPTNEP